MRAARPLTPPASWRRPDVARPNAGERIIFEPYTKDFFEEMLRWIGEHGIFADSGMGECKYEEAVVAA